MSHAYPDTLGASEQPLLNTHHDLTPFASGGPASLGSARALVKFAGSYPDELAGGVGLALPTASLVSTAQLTHPGFDRS